MTCSIAISCWLSQVGYRLYRQKTKPICRRHKKMFIYKPREEDNKEANRVDTLNAGFQPPQSSENTFLILQFTKNVILFVEVLGNQYTMLQLSSIPKLHYMYVYRYVCTGTHTHTPGNCIILRRLHYLEGVLAKCLVESTLKNIPQELANILLSIKT